MVDVRCMSACRSLPWPPVKAFAPPIFSNCFKASVVSGEESCADSGGNSLTRIRVPCTGGVSTSPGTGGSTLKRSIVAGAPFVFQTSKKRGPFGPIGRCSGGLVSLAMMATPLSLCPVTMRLKDFDMLPSLKGDFDSRPSGLLCAGLISCLRGRSCETDRASVLQDRAVPPTPPRGARTSRACHVPKVRRRISTSRHVGSSYRRDNRYHRYTRLHHHWDYVHSSKSPTRYDGAKGPPACVPPLPANPVVP